MNMSRPDTDRSMPTSEKKGVCILLSVIPSLSIGNLLLLDMLLSLGTHLSMAQDQDIDVPNFDFLCPCVECRRIITILICLRRVGLETNPASCGNRVLQFLSSDL